MYKLQVPFREYGDTENSNQYSTFFKEPGNIWWIDDFRQDNVDSDWKYFRFVAANNDGEFIYKMNADDFSIEKISSSLHNQYAI